MANEMIMTNGFVSAVGFDFSEAFAIANPAKSATLTQVIAKNGVGSVNNVVVQKIVRELSKTGASGGKAEGADAGEAEKSKKTTLQNYTEIYTKVASVSGTANAINGAAYGDELNDRVDEIKEDINYNMLNGKKSATDPRKMGGFIESAKHTVTLAGETLTEEELDVAIQKLNTTGDVRLAVNPADMYKVQRTLIGDKAQIQMATSETVAGIMISKYISAQGVVITLYAEYALEAGTYLLFDIDKAEYDELRAMHVKPLGATGDNEKAEVITEVTCFCNPASTVVIKKAA